MRLIFVRDVATLLMGNARFWPPKEGGAWELRRYCIARSVDADGKFRPVVFNIGEDLGMIGWGYRVEWCVIGLDRNHAYEPSCSVLRPFAARYLGEAAIRARY